MTVKNLGGAPLGNKNAVGHGAPKKNKNAVKHGLYEKIVIDNMLEDDKELYLSLLEASGHHEELAKLRFKYIHIAKAEDNYKNKDLLNRIVKKISRILMNECYLHSEHENRRLKRSEVNQIIQELLKT